VKQSNATGSVWVVFNRSNSSRNAILVAFEVDYAIQAFMSTTPMSERYSTMMVSATFSVEPFTKRLMRLICCDFIKGKPSDEAA
jgi:hypothetical protein